MNTNQEEINEEINFQFDTIKFDSCFRIKENIQSSHAILNFLGFKWDENKISKDTLIKFVFKILREAICMSKSIFLLINDQKFLENLPEIFEKSVSYNSKR